MLEQKLVAGEEGGRALHGRGLDSNTPFLAKLPEVLILKRYDFVYHKHSLTDVSVSILSSDDVSRK